MAVQLILDAIEGFGQLEEIAAGDLKVVVPAGDPRGEESLPMWRSNRETRPELAFSALSFEARGAPA